MFKFYNANPLGRHVDDCTVRAISLAERRSWDATYEILSLFAQAQAIMPNEVQYIDDFLEKTYHKICGCKDKYKITVGDFVREHPHGTYLITMNGHITCAIDGVIYDTFDPSDRFVWGAYKVDPNDLHY